MTPIPSIAYAAHRPLLHLSVQLCRRFGYVSTDCGLPTDYFQASLPRLPIPKLNKTMERYINSQKALLDPVALQRTQKITAQFLSNAGPTLQRELEAYNRANPHTSYISGLWFDMYLKDRRPVVLTHNPAMVLQDTKLGAGYQQPAVRATNLLYHVVSFCHLLRANKLEPDVFHLNPHKSRTPFFYQTMRFVPTSIATYAAYLFKAYPLDTSQYASMFNATRIPELGTDKLFSKPSARHLLVIRHGEMFVFDVLDLSGNPIPPLQLLANLRFILLQPASPNPTGIGVITTLPRDDAFAARQRLLSLGNHNNLELVDSALFALVFDEEPLSDNIENVLFNFLTGPATSRWFDKSISILIDLAGRAAINFEHSWGDGVAVVRLGEDIYERSEAHPVVGPEDLTSCSLSHSVSRLEWTLDDGFISDWLLPNREAYDARRRNVVLRCARQHGLSKSLCKKAQVSPDAMMQLSFQLAHDLVHGRPASTYESCSTAAFRHGRTETLRSATVETRRVVELMRSEPNIVHSLGGARKPVDNAVSDSDLMHALVACSSRHGQLTKEAAMGQGWDRHLFALRHFANKQTGIALPELFLDENYTLINTIILSTSTLFSPAFSIGGFAAVHHDGYGIAYRIKDDECGAVFTAWRNSSYTNAGELADAFIISSRKIAHLLQQMVH